MRKFEFQTGEFYHIYNRGVDKREVFLDEKDYIRFLRSMREFNDLEPIGSLYIKKKLKNQSGTLRSLAPLRGAKPLRKPLVEFICYCLNPNHYHFILRQVLNKGISEFMKKLAGGYTCYFNIEYKRSGSLFENTFKAIHIKSDSYFLWLSGYINGNAEIHKIARAENWIWASYLDYMGKRGGTLCNKEIILSQFENKDEYKDLVDTIIKESSQGKEEMKKYLLE
ncbi:MAG: transposase [Patescibacteria group bacterium]|nr:transposase [Patescibacteria group bacterium]